MAAPWRSGSTPLVLLAISSAEEHLASQRILHFQTGETGRSPAKEPLSWRGGGSVVFSSQQPSPPSHPCCLSLCLSVSSSLFPSAPTSHGADVVSLSGPGLRAEACLRRYRRDRLIFSCVSASKNSFPCAHPFPL